MPPTVVEVSIHIRILWLLGGSPLGENTFYAQVGSGATVDQSMATTVAGNWSAAMTSSGILPLLASDVVCDGITIRDVRTANNPLISADLNIPGSSASDLLPRGNALVVTNRTSRAGRSFRGRTYVLGFAENATGGDGRATQPAMDAAAALISDFADNMAGNGWPLGVASLFSEGVRRDPGIITPITGSVVRDAIWDRQWRRARR